MISVGPLALALERLFAVLGIVVFMATANWIGRRHGPDSDKAAWRALLVGLVDTSLRAFMPGLLRQVMTGSEADALGAGLASMGIYLLMAIVLLVRPKGLFPAHV